MDIEQFYRQATAVMNAPYWTDFSAVSDEEAEADRAAYGRFVMARMDEKDALYEALDGCQRYEDLPPEARAIYDKVLAALKAGEKSPPAAQ